MFEKSGTFEAVDGKRAVVEARATPPSGNWDVIASFATPVTPSCAAGDRLDFELISTSGDRVTAFSTHDPLVNPPVGIPCGPGSFTIPSVPPGPYEFSDWVHVDASGATEYAYSTCRAAWLQGSIGSSTITVAEVTAAAPSPEGNPGVCP